MNLPNELWNLICYNLKFELDLYKNCPLVNKRLYAVTKQLYDRIPNQLRIETFQFHPRENSLFNVIDTSLSYYCSNNCLDRLNCFIVGYPNLIDKNELLKKVRIGINCDCLYSNCFKTVIRITPEKYLDDNFNQICHSIGFEVRDAGFYIYYCQ